MFTGTTTVPPGTPRKSVGRLKTGSGPDGRLLGTPGQLGTCATGVPARYRFNAVASAAVIRPSPVMSAAMAGSSTGKAAKPESAPAATRESSTLSALV